MLQKLLGEEWYQIMKPVIDDGLLSDIAKKVNYDRNKYDVIPPKGSLLMFRAFRETPYSKVKLVILGQDPYTGYENGIPIFDGLAFSNGASYHPSPSLVNILKEIENSHSEGLDLNRTSKYDLTSWANQGVLLINTAHSVRKHSPGSHLKYWKRFTKHVLEKLNEKDDLVWLLWGNHAIRHGELVTNRSHAKICTSHPSPLAFKKTVKNYPAFSGSNCFIEANNELKARNKSKIIW